MSPLLARAIEIAASQIGVREQPRGSNSGPEVDTYLAAVGLPPGNSWCASFVAWVFQRAANDCGESLPIPVTGSVHTLFERSPIWCHVARPLPGAIFGIDHGHGLGHCGIVVSVDFGGLIATIEGNTDGTGGREGDGVYRRSRKVSEINMGYLLLDHDAADAARAALAL